MLLSHAEIMFRESTLQKAPQTKSNVKTKKEKREDRKIYCANCHQLVTHPGESTSVSGAHTHTFTNPAGLVFTIDCYSSAPGCVVIGKATKKDTWFPGFAWQIAICRNCEIHLGWYFKGAGAFFALIQSRLTDSAGD